VVERSPLSVLDPGWRLSATTPAHENHKNATGGRRVQDSKREASPSFIIITSELTSKRRTHTKRQQAPFLSHTHARAHTTSRSPRQLKATLTHPTITHTHNTRASGTRLSWPTLLSSSASFTATRWSSGTPRTDIHTALRLLHLLSSSLSPLSFFLNQLILSSPPSRPCAWLEGWSHIPWT
jgi:hypothetical protein